MTSHDHSRHPLSDSLIVAVVVMLALFARPLARAQFGEIPEQRPRIDGVIAKLEKESAEQSLDLLVNDQHQYDLIIYPSQMPVPQVDLEETLSNRRVVKVLDYLDSLAAVERNARCRSLFKSILTTHSDNFLIALRHMADPAAPTTGRSFRVAKRAMITIMISIATSGRVDTLDHCLQQLGTFERDLEANYRAQIWKDHEPPLEILKIYNLLDFRTKLNLLFLAAGSNTNTTSAVHLRLSEIRDKMEMRKEIFPVVAWNARTTLAESTFAGGHVDASKGLRRIAIYSFWDRLYFDSAAQQTMFEDVRAILIPRN